MANIIIGDILLGVLLCFLRVYIPAGTSTIDKEGNFMVEFEIMKLLCIIMMTSIV